MLFISHSPQQLEQKLPLKCTIEDIESLGIEGLAKAFFNDILNGILHVEESTKAQEYVLKEDVCQWLSKTCHFYFED
jgi:hypothetical protein